MCVLQRYRQCKNTQYVAITIGQIVLSCSRLNTNGNLQQISILTCVLRSAMTIACIYVRIRMYVCVFMYVCMYIVYYTGVQHHDATLVNVFVIL